MNNQEPIVCKGSYFTLVWFGFVSLICFSGLFAFIRSLFTRPASSELYIGCFIAVGCTVFSAFKTYQGFVRINTELTIQDGQIALKQFKGSVTIKLSEITKIQGIRRKTSLFVIDTHGRKVIIDSGLKNFVQIAEYVFTHASGAEVAANSGYFFLAKDSQEFLAKHNINVQQ